MGSSTLRLSLSKLLLIALAVIFLISLAISSIAISNCIDEQYRCQNIDTDLPLNKLYIRRSASKSHQLKKEYLDNVESLEFMTWDRERVSLAKRLLSIQYQRLNLNPLNAQIWLDLNNLSLIAGVEKNERDWVLDKSIGVAGWNYQNSPVLIYHCVITVLDSPNHSSLVCSDVLLNLPSGAISHNARNANISVQNLKKAIAIVRSNKGIESDD